MSALLLLPLLSLVAAQQAGTWTMNASVPDSGAANAHCVVLAQITAGTPNVIQAMYPICPPGTPFASTPVGGPQVNWPIAANAGDGNGITSSAVMYGAVVSVQSRTDPYSAQAGCGLALTEDQVQYLLGRSLTWNNNLQELWDNTANGFVMDGTTGGALTCGHDESLVPASLWLPDPYKFGPTDPTWQDPITLATAGGNGGGGGAGGGASSSTSAVVGLETSTSSSSASTSTDPSQSTSASSSSDSSASGASSATSKTIIAILPSSTSSAVLAVYPSSSSSSMSSLGGVLVAPASSSQTSSVAPSTSTSAGSLTSISSAASSTSSADLAAIITSSTSSSSSASGGDCGTVTVTEVVTSTVTSGMRRARADRRVY